MFGYVTVNKDELKIKEYRVYQSYYCGLCSALYKRHGITGQITLNFDMVFLGMLLCGLYEPKTEKMEKRCPVHPMEKHLICKNEIMDYAADMTILLSYHNLEDGWQDEHSIVKKTGAGILHGKYKRVAAAYPKQTAAVVQYMKELNELQDRNTEDIDKIAGLTGSMMGAIFCYKEDEWTDLLSKTGFYLGKFIYLLDAYDDLESDIKKNQYNVWKHTMKDPDFEINVEHILDMMMAACCKEFEKLPILQDIGILRNILYAGVFTKYNLRVQSKLRHRNEEKRD